MKIFDCIQFFDENMMLDLRLNILNEHVDYFVIVENLFMHSGKKKIKILILIILKSLKKKLYIFWLTSFQRLI